MPPSARAKAKVKSEAAMSRLCCGACLILKVLYRRRWNVELELRNIKTTLSMALLRCKAPEMVVKEL